MGISPFSSFKSSDYSKPKPISGRLIGGISGESIVSSSKAPYVNLPNPKPDNYTILDEVQAGTALVIKIKYHDCTNYEGVKVLVYRNTTIKELKKQKYIDPHFSENEKFKSPIARFEPTENGWNDALDYAFKIGMGLE